MKTTKTGPTIEQLRADLAKVTREREAYKKAKQENDDRFMIERDAARADLARVTSERDELRAIVEGRKVAPTLAEIAKHSGEWLCDGRRVALYFADDNDTLFRARVDAIASHDYLEGDYARKWLALQNVFGALWIALDDGRPCAWPKVTP